MVRKRVTASSISTPWDAARKRDKMDLSVKDRSAPFQATLETTVATTSRSTTRGMIIGNPRNRNNNIGNDARGRAFRIGAGDARHSSNMVACMGSCLLHLYSA